LLKRIFNLFFLLFSSFLPLFLGSIPDFDFL